MRIDKKTNEAYNNNKDNKRSILKNKGVNKMEERKKVKKLVSITEAGKIFGIGRDIMYALVRSEPDLPKIKIGQVTKINVSLMEEWLDNATKEGRSL